MPLESLLLPGGMGCIHLLRSLLLVYALFQCTDTTLQSAGHGVLRLHWISDPAEPGKLYTWGLCPELGS